MKDLFATCKLLILLSLITLYSSCQSIDTNQSKDVSFRRNWVRRVAPKSALTRNSSSQRFTPILLSRSLIQGSTFGGIKTFARRSGQVKWEIEDKNGISSHGQVADGKLFYGSYSGKANAYNIKERKFDWAVSLDSAPLSFSEIRNNKIFCLTDAGTLYALSTDTGAVLWSVKKPSQKNLQIFGGPSPVLYGDQVISSFPDGSVLSLDQNTGKQKWDLKFESYQKFQDADFLVLDGLNLFVGSFDEAIYSVNLSDGGIKWRVMQGPVSSVTVDGSRLYYSSNQSEIISLDKSSGKIIFKKKVLKGVGNKPSVLSNFLIVSDSKGPVFVFDKNSGQLITKYDSGAAVSSDFTVDSPNNKIYYLSNKGNLFKFGIERNF